MEIKAHEYAALIRRAEIPYRIILVFGPDRGLVSERAAEIAAATRIDLKDDFSVVRMEAGEIGSDAGRLIDEAKSVSLFGGERLIWVRNAGNERGLTEAVKILAGDAMTGSRLIVEAGDLKKSAALRKTVIEAKSALGIPCYADDGRALQALIDEEMGAAGLRITADARHRLSTLLGGDRLASRGELRKLAIYCQGQDTVGEDDVIEAIGDVASLSVDDAVDCVLSGDPAGFDQAFERIEKSKTSSYLVLRTLIQQFELLDQMRAAIEVEKKQAAAVMAELGRGIHFKRKPVIEKALRYWQSAAIRREIDRLGEAVYESRRRAALENQIVRHALLRVCLFSARFSGR